MKLSRLDYELLSLMRMIDDDRLDLQPTFQRGQVWTVAKQQRLIDSILRDWYVPPIHVVVNENLDRDEVLDGQQRLQAIHDFMNGKFSVNGLLEPYNEQIADLDKLKYRDLPMSIRSRFTRFVITTIRLEQYEPSEPGELFFRLNQPTALTSAEQRNALIGATRDQIRTLSELLEERAEGQSIGFTNARMNFDDILSRVALTVELGSLHEKITASRLASKYRTGTAFSDLTIRRLRKGIIKFACAIQDTKVNVRFNKATLYSWMIFIIDNEWENNAENTEGFCDFIVGFESARSRSVDLYDLSGQAKSISVKLQNDAFNLLSAFNDRASSRVNDVSSVVVRDSCLNAALVWCGPHSLRFSISDSKAQKLRHLFDIFRYAEPHRLADTLESRLDTLDWGRAI